jgi:hypothetical protein
MILYSIIPAEVVFGDYERSNENKYIEIDYLGEKVQVTPLENSRYVINRIISTSPRAYINPKLQPGTVISSSVINR